MEHTHALCRVPAHSLGNHAVFNRNPFPHRTGGWSFVCLFVCFICSWPDVLWPTSRHQPSRLCRRRRSVDPLRPGTDPHPALPANPFQSDNTNGLHSTRQALYRERECARSEPSHQLVRPASLVRSFCPFAYAAGWRSPTEPFYCFFFFLRGRCLRLLRFFCCVVVCFPYCQPTTTTDGSIVQFITRPATLYPGGA